jgi:hypothetical protein
MTGQQNGRTQVIMMGEFGTDTDEALAAVLASGLTRDQYLDLVAIIGSHLDSMVCAQSVKFILNSLGLSHVSVGVGEIGFGASTTNFERDPRFLVPATQLFGGREALRWALQHSDDNSVVLVLNGGFTDAVWLWMDAPNLFKAKIRKVVIMGGIEMDGELPRLSSEGFLVPSLGQSGAANNCFDPGATLHLYDLLQRHGIPTVITTRFAAYQCLMPFTTYEALARTGHVIGDRINKIQHDRINELWRKANAEPGTPGRGNLPARFTPQTFIDRFCGGIQPPLEPGQVLKDIEDITPYVQEVALYDPINLVAAIDALFDEYFDPHYITVREVRHAVIGLDDQHTGIRDQYGLRRLIIEGMRRALLMGATPIAA